MMLWSYRRKTLLLATCLGMMISTSYSTNQCCADNIIYGEKPVCVNGTSLDIKCANTSFVMLLENVQYRISNGEVVLRTGFSDLDIVPHDEFCLGILKDSKHDGARVAAVCHAYMMDDSHTYPEDKRLYYNPYSYFLLVSVLFLAATLAVYCGLPSLWDLGGKCLMCFVGSLALGYLSLFALQQNYINYYDSSELVCTVFGFWTYFWLLCSFTWLFLISFNIWYQSKYVIKHVAERTLWLLYLTFGFGVPTIFQVGAILSYHLPNILLQPNIGDGVCWFQGKTEIWLYFSGPMAVFLFFNVVFFVCTTRLLWINYKDARPQTRIRRLRFKMALYLKLFLAMGLTWIFELASFAFSLDLYVADVLNSLQGPIIFIIMVFTRRKIMESLTCSNSFFTVCFHCSKTWKQQDSDDENTTQGSTDIQLS